MSGAQSGAPLLSVCGLSVHFPERRAWGFGKAPMRCTVSDVSFTVNRGEVVGIVGESGSGKTTVAKMIVRLLKPTDGTIELAGQNVLEFSAEQVQSVLRRNVRLIFQDPDAVLNPSYTIRTGLERAITLHQQSNVELTARELRERVEDALLQVGLDASYAEKYPDQLSGGQKRRVGVARALCTRPLLIVADEPLSGLDVLLQEQVLELLLREQARLGFGLLLVSHDLDRVHQVCNRVLVMYAGRVVELVTLGASNVSDSSLYRHPYSQLLQAANDWGETQPFSDGKRDSPVGSDLMEAYVGGSSKIPKADVAGCVFAGRCARQQRVVDSRRCETERPRLKDLEEGHAVACHYPDQV